MTNLELAMFGSAQGLGTLKFTVVTQTLGEPLIDEQDSLSLDRSYTSYCDFAKGSISAISLYTYLNGVKVKELLFHKGGWPLFLGLQTFLG